MLPINKIHSIILNKDDEINHILYYSSNYRSKTGDLNKVDRMYKDLKALGFFKLVSTHFNNTESRSDRPSVKNDIFKHSSKQADIFFIIELSKEAHNEFRDDGKVAFKLREWVKTSYDKLKDVKVVERPSSIWDDIFKGWPLPSSVKTMPFFKEKFIDDVPGLIIYFYKED